MSSTPVLLGLVALGRHAWRTAEGELVDGLGIMGRVHQPEVINAGRRCGSRWSGLRHLAMHLATEDERNRLASRMTFPLHVQVGEALRIEARLNEPADPCLVSGVDFQPGK